MIIYGCTSGSNNKVETSEAINQLGPSGLKQGLWEEYEDSILISRGTYKDGLPEGLWTRWYTNGQMRDEGHYTAGVKSGMWVEWYPDGVIMWKGEYDNGRREITGSGARVEVLFPQQEHNDGVLSKDSIYHLQIRIQNIPSTNLFVEVSSGQINREGQDSDQFVLRTSSDSICTLAVGFMPDLEFMDFRNLVSEIDFKLE